MQPTTVWIVVAKGLDGAPAGLAHTTGCIHLSEDEAITEHDSLGKVIRQYFSVEECVIMGSSNYKPVS